MKASILSENISTPRAFIFTSLDASAKIVPKHKKSFSNICKLNIDPVVYNDYKYFTSSTPRKIAEANYKRKEIYDIEFNLQMEKEFKETLEMKQKRQKIEERKRKEEEFNALKEAKNKIKQEEMKKTIDDYKRQQEKIKTKYDIMIEKKKQDNLFKQDKRKIFIENTYIKKKQLWEYKVKEREDSLNTLRVKENHA